MENNNQADKISFPSLNGSLSDATNGKPLYPDLTDQSPTDGQYTYKKYGFLQSRNQGASPIAFEVELGKIYENFKNKLRKDEAEQEKMKHPIRQRLESLKVDKSRLKEKIEMTKQESIPGIRIKIENIKNDMAAIRRDPSAFQVEKPNKMSFVFGCVILSILTVYLWIFYTSAGYSAFFREFSVSDIKVANSIFDAEAIVKAWRDGVPAFILVLSMPFIFLGLGYLIHKFMGDKGWKKYIWIPLLIIVTFLFDFIIAYEIVHKIYELKAANSLEEVPPYRISMAFTDINFWLIIFAGFVTYLIWGFLFDRLMEEYQKFDVVQHQLKIREKELKELQQELKSEEAKVQTLQDQLTAMERDIKVCEEDLNATFFKPKEFEHVIYQFASGWLQFIEGGLLTTEEKKNAIRNETKTVMQQFINKHNNPVIYETA